VTDFATAAAQIQIISGPVCFPRGTSHPRWSCYPPLLRPGMARRPRTVFRQLRGSTPFAFFEPTLKPNFGLEFDSILNDQQPSPLACSQLDKLKHSNLPNSLARRRFNSKGS